MDKFKYKIEQARQWVRDNSVEVMVISAAASAASAVVYGGYSVYKAGKHNDALLAMTRESLDHYKEHYRG